MLRPRNIALVLTAVFSLAIFIGALTPLPVPPSVPGTDKLHHLISFAVLVLPCAMLSPRDLIWVLPAAVIQGGLIEIIQPLVNREKEWADFVADLKGIGIGLCLGLFLNTLGRRMRRHQRRNQPG